MSTTEALQRISDMDPQSIRGDDMGRAARIAREALAALAATSAPAEPTAVPEALLTALRFYARGEHFHVSDSPDDPGFESVSGEPENWLCSNRDDDETMIEDGTIALQALRGTELNWRDGDDDHTPQPVDGEVFSAAPALATSAPSEPAGDGWTDNVLYLLERCPHAVRVREGGGPENLLSSLCVTFQKMQGLLASQPTPAVPVAADGQPLDARQSIAVAPQPEPGVRICPEKDIECGTHLCAMCPKAAQPEAPAEPSRSQKLASAGFTARDNKLPCEECGERLSPLGLQVHKCAGGEAPAEPSAIADRIFNDVAELGDRNSPDDWPEAMRVTHDELRTIVLDAIAAPPAEVEERRELSGIPTNEQIADAMECWFSENEDWPEGDAEVVNAWLRYGPSILAKSKEKAS
jgi:hypothetical protein